MDNGKWIVYSTVLAAGDYPSHEVPLQVLANAECVVCCDSAAERYLAEGHVPDAIVGDGDSLSAKLKECYAAIWHHETEQDTNDLSKAIRYLMSQGKRHIAIVGATGKREDHTLGNISLLIEYMRMGLDVQMYTDHGVFIPCHDDQSFTLSVGQQVSIISFGAIAFHAEGLKYPLYDFTNWWQGTLNEAVSERVTIHADGDYLLYLPYV